MYKKIISLLIILLITLTPIVSAISNTTNEKQIQIKNSEPKKWTWMFYNDADFTNAYDPLNDFAAEVNSTENVDVIVLQDTNTGPGKIWYIHQNHSLELIETLDEVDMGNYTTLKDFVTYGKINYPSDRYLLSVYNHGGGWTGACIDTTNQGWLTMDDFQKALNDSNNLDIICFTAPCLMGAFESAYELRDCVDVYIGSEELSGFMYWFDTLDDICALLDNQSAMSNIEIGEEIIKIIGDNLESNPDKQKYAKPRVTMSAIDSSKLNSLSNSVHNLSEELLNKLSKIGISARFKLRLINSLTQNFGRYTKIKVINSILDLYDFAEKCSTFFAFNNKIKTQANNVMQDIDEAVIANLRGTMHPRAYGLTIYFPINTFIYDERYTSTGLDFVEDTSWDEMLEEFYII